MWQFLSRLQWFRKVGEDCLKYFQAVDYGDVTTIIKYRWSYVCGPGTPPLIGQTIGQVCHLLVC